MAAIFFAIVFIALWTMLTKVKLLIVGKTYYLKQKIIVLYNFK